MPMYLEDLRGPTPDPGLGVLYRYKDHESSSGYMDEMDYWHPGGSSMEVELVAYSIIRRTPKGCWVHIPYSVNEKRFVLTDARKKFAYETQEAALKSFIFRKNKQIEILTRQLRNAQRAREIAVDIRDNNHV